MRTTMFAVLFVVISSATSAQEAESLTPEGAVAECQRLAGVEEACVDEGEGSDESVASCHQRHSSNTDDACANACTKLDGLDEGQYDRLVGGIWRAGRSVGREYCR